MCGPMQDDVRSHARTPHDLDVPPTHAAHPRAQQLHHRLLGGESAGQLRGPPPRVPNFPLAVDPLQKSVAVLAKDPFHPVDLYDVDSCDQH